MRQGKKKKAKKARKPSAPSAYILFCKGARQKVLDENPGIAQVSMLVV